MLRQHRSEHIVPMYVAVDFLFATNQTDADTATKMISEHYIGHRFFSLDNTDLWIRDLAFQAYMDTFHGSFDEYRTRQSTPFSSRAPSRSASSIGSRAPSRDDSSFSAVDSRPSSRASVIPSSYAPSSRSSSPISFNNNATVLLDGEDDSLAALAPPRMAPMLEDALTPSLPADAPPTIAKSRKGKQKASSPGIRLTRELAVDEIVPISTIPATWTVPRVPAAYLVELHDSIDVLKVGNRTVAIDGFIRSEVMISSSNSCPILNCVHYRTRTRGGAQVVMPKAMCRLPVSCPI